MLHKKVNFFIQNNRHSIISFLIVGALTAGLYFSLFVLLWRKLHFFYQSAISIAYVLSISFHFLSNRVFTFKNKGGIALKQLFKYLIVASTNYVITLFVMYVVVTRFFVSPYIGIILSIGITVGTGYLLSLFWVFPMPVNNFKETQCDT